jgi:DNA-binding MarR family transcriptional regulator
MVKRSAPSGRSRGTAPAGSVDPVTGVRLSHPADSIAVRITRLARLMSRQAKQALQQKFGLGLAEWRCISTLAAYGSMSSADLCRRLDYDRAQVSRIVAFLDKEGVVTKPPAATKAAHLHLTEKGLALYEEVLPWSRERQVRFLSLLEPGHRSALDEALQTLTTAVAEDLAAAGVRGGD